MSCQTHDLLLWLLTFFTLEGVRLPLSIITWNSQHRTSKLIRLFQLSRPFDIALIGKACNTYSVAINKMFYNAQLKTRTALIFLEYNYGMLSRESM
jgi:hypothetical protein